MTLSASAEGQTLEVAGAIAEFLRPTDGLPLSHYACWRCQGRGARMRRVRTQQQQQQQQRQQTEGAAAGGGELAQETVHTPTTAGDGGMHSPSAATTEAFRVLSEPCTVCGSTGLLPVARYRQHAAGMIRAKAHADALAKGLREPTAAEAAALAAEERTQVKLRRTVVQKMAQKVGGCQCTCVCPKHHHHHRHATCIGGGNDGQGGAQQQPPHTPPPPSPPPRLPRVVISGCGIAGAALALALQQRGIDCVVYEKDVHFDVRRQGYGLTMQQGALALSHLGLSVPGVVSDSHFSFDHQGEILGCYGHSLISGMHKKKQRILKAATTSATAPSSSSSAPTPSSPSSAVSDRVVTQQTRHNAHLPRQRLRRALINSLKPGTVRWGCAVEQILPNPALEKGGIGGGKDSDAVANGGMDADDDDDGALSPARRVHFRLSSGEVDWCDVLVGADGVRSPIRRFKMPSDDALVFLNTIVVLGYAPTVHPLLRRRVCQSLDGHNRLYSMPFTGTHLPKSVDTPTSTSSRSAAPAANAAEDGGDNANAPASTTAATLAAAAEVAAGYVHDAEADDDDARAALAALHSDNRANLGYGGVALPSGDSEGVRTFIHPSSGGANAHGTAGTALDIELPGDTTMWQASWPSTEREALLLAQQGPAALLEACRQRMGSWHAPLPQLLAATPIGCVTGYPTYDREPPTLEALRWGRFKPHTREDEREEKAFSGVTMDADCATRYRQPLHNEKETAAVQGEGEEGDVYNVDRIVLIGDAAHPMSPFKGQGANQALLDAVTLATALRDAMPFVRYLANGGAGGGVIGGGLGDPLAEAAPVQLQPPPTAQRLHPYTVAMRSVLEGMPCTCGDVGVDVDGAVPLPPKRPRADDSPSCDVAGNEGGSGRALLSSTSPRCGCRCELHTLPTPLQTPTSASINSTPAPAATMTQFISETYGATIGAALAHFERAMVGRTAAKVLDSRCNAAFLHTPSALAPANCTRSQAAARELRGDGDGGGGHAGVGSLNTNPNPAAPSCSSAPAAAAASSAGSSSSSPSAGLNTADLSRAKEEAKQLLAMPCYDAYIA